jgi:hypothetical protein
VQCERCPQKSSSTRDNNVPGTFSVRHEQYFSTQNVCEDNRKPAVRLTGDNDGRREIQKQIKKSRYLFGGQKSLR